MSKLLSVSVMAHPSRKDNFEYLSSRLGGAPFSIDEGVGIWENCKRAWRLHDPEAEYHVVIQDDAIVCDNFLERAEKKIIEARAITATDPALSFFFGKRQWMKDVGYKGMKVGRVIGSQLHWGLAVCLPTKYIEEMIAAGDKIHIKQDDARIARFLRAKKIPVFYPMPSLIDHRIGESLVGDPGRARSAYAYEN